jgi:hypothetical protein
MGPSAAAKEAMNTRTATSSAGPCAFVPRSHATADNDSTWAVSPINNSGRRPARSIRISATSVKSRLQLSQSDIISFHDYNWPEKFKARVTQLAQHGRPLICTEYMARGAGGSTIDGDLRIGKIANVGMINWGFVVGKSQTNLPWDSWQRPYTLQQPLVWHHDLLQPDGDARQSG